MLFDEQRCPYYLMLQNFVKSGGQNAFIDSFMWALSIGHTVSLDEGLEHPDLPEGTGEFLATWLMLAEKMVNSKTVLQSPHVLPTNSKTSATVKPFNPVQYLIRTHKAIFEAIMHLWNKKPLKVYGARMSESILTILCSILKGEAVLKERVAKDKQQAAATSLATTSAASVGGHRPGPLLSSVEYLRYAESPQPLDGLHRPPHIANILTASAPVPVSATTQQVQEPVVNHQNLRQVRQNSLCLKKSTISFDVANHTQLYPLTQTDKS